MRALLSAAFATLVATLPALADDAPPSGSLVDKGMAMFDGGKLLATGGVSSLEGAGGGGLATWALITGYGTRDGAGIDGHATYIALPNYSLWTEGAAIGLFDRVELSYTHLTFDTEKVGALLGLGRDFKFEQDVYGAKVKLIGDAVYDQDSLLPQIAVGVQYKDTNHADILHLVGAKSNTGTDYYIAATKLFLAQSVLVDVTLRETKANQFGILGFGGDKHDDYSTQVEASAAYLFSRNFAVGAEYRTKPDNLGIAKENGAWDVFAAYFINKNVSVTAAYLDLGNIVIEDHQRGVYASLQVGI
ncbi:MAG TPA: DUF3034 family protein [Rhizomicrobium sp.]|jgi:hypothetical protein|nr:DUF3034 family protein [Rhizomicrobium sp.]